MTTPLPRYLQRLISQHIITEKDALSAQMGIIAEKLRPRVALALRAYAQALEKKTHVANLQTYKEADSAMERAAELLETLSEIERAYEPWNDEAGSLARSRARVVREGKFRSGVALTPLKLIDWADRTVQR